MRHYSDQWIQEWCQENGWTDLIKEKYNQYWAFPPGGYIPEPIPPKVLRGIKAEKGFCNEEKVWLTSAFIFSVLAIIVSYIFKCPLPIVFAFAIDAVTAAKLEVEF
jgi:hypothetical protein